MRVYHSVKPYSASPQRIILCLPAKPKRVEELSELVLFASYKIGIHHGGDGAVVHAPESESRCHVYALLGRHSALIVSCTFLTLYMRSLRAGSPIRRRPKRQAATTIVPIRQ